MYFDEMYIVHEKNNTALQVLQATDYYPYGLSFNEYDKERLKEVSPGVYAPELRNRYRFQNQELQKDLDLGWYHYKYRMHDPAIGRFGGVDPLAEDYLYNGTYVFSENRLTNGIELEGAEFMWSPLIVGWNASAMGHCNCTDPGFGSYMGSLFYRGTDMGQGLFNFQEGVRRNAANSINYSLNPGEMFQQSLINDGGASILDIESAYQAEDRLSTEQWQWGLFQAGSSAAMMQLGFASGALSSSTSQLGFANYGEALYRPTVRIGAGQGGYSFTSTAVRSALADRVGKRGFSEVGYQFQKHFGRGGAWGEAIPEGATLNPATFNQAGYNTFKEIWRSPGNFQRVGGFLEKRLSDGRGIRLQENWLFKGFLD